MCALTICTGVDVSTADASALTKCLFPVAGYGTRFLPATKSVPKEMLPVVAKPMVHYCVEESLEAGMEEICFVTGRGKRSIADYFDVNYELETELRGSPKMEKLASVNDILTRGRFSFTRQSYVKGLGDAVASGRMLVGWQDFGLILSDNLCFVEDGAPNVMQQLRTVYEKYDCSVLAVHEVSDETRSLYGIVDGDTGGLNGCIKVRKMVEKPKDRKEVSTNYGIIGRYILKPDIFDCLERTQSGTGGEIQLTDALRLLVEKQDLLALPVDMDHFDCGSVEGYVAATNYCYRRFWS